MASNTSITEIDDVKEQAAPVLSADVFQTLLFGANPEPVRKQPWKAMVDVKEQHYIHVVSDNLRLWGKHVAAHSWSVVLCFECFR